MKYLNVLSFFVAMSLFLHCDTAQNSDDDQMLSVPEISTLDPTNITAHTVATGGKFINDGGGELVDKGIVWNFQPKPSLSNGRVSAGSDQGDFEMVVGDLPNGEILFIRAYAQNELGLAFGQEFMITTKFFDGTVEIPCEPEKNTADYVNQTIAFDNAHIDNLGNYYEVRGISSSGELYFEFQEAPQTGVYKTVSSFEQHENDQCRVSGHFGGTFGCQYGSALDHPIYVIKDGNDDYNISYCDLLFQCNSNGHSFNGNGNLTTN